MPAGTKVTGTVTVTPIPGTLSDLNLNVDTAIDVHTDFGANTVALGLSPDQAFYISSSAHTLSGVVVQTGNPQLPRMVLEPQ